MTAAPVPDLVRQLVRGPDRDGAVRRLEELYRGGGLLAEFVHPLIPVLLGVVATATGDARSNALEVLADITHGTPMHPEPGEDAVDDVADEGRRREALRSGTELYYAALEDAGDAVAALELIFFVEGHSERLEEALERLSAGNAAVDRTVAWIRASPSRVDEPLLVGATGQFRRTELSLGDGRLPVRFAATAAGESRRELLAVAELGGGLFELRQSPLYVAGLARGDRFSLDESGAVASVVSRSGAVTVQVRDYEGVSPGLVERLGRVVREVGGDVDGHDAVSVSVWVPETADFGPVRRALDLMRDTASFEEWIVANPRPTD